MRTAHVITRLIIGGAQENTLFNVDDQHHLFGDEVCLITGPGLGPEGSLEPRALAGGYPVHIVPEMRRSLHPLRDWRSYRALIELLRKIQPLVRGTNKSSLRYFLRDQQYRYRSERLLRLLTGSRSMIVITRSMQKRQR